jgi:hypothetical protein
VKIRVEHAREEALHARLEFRANVEMVSPETFERAGGFSAKGTLVEKAYESVQKK